MRVLAAAPRTQVQHAIMSIGGAEVLRSTSDAYSRVGFAMLRAAEVEELLVAGQEPRSSRGMGSTLR